MHPSSVLRTLEVAGCPIEAARVKALCIKGKKALDVDGIWVIGGNELTEAMHISIL